MIRDSQSRKWQITINNPIEKGYTHEKIKQIIEEIKPIVYWCMSDEIGENETFHTHLYIACSSGVRFSTIKNKFDGGHFEMAQGTSQQNRDYIFKQGEKWGKDKKKETNLKDSHEEQGELPLERPGTRNDLNDLYDMIRDNMTNAEIIRLHPQYMFQIDRIERARQTIKEEEFSNTYRQLEVVYIHGPTGTGKTRSVMEVFGYSNVYRVTDYEHPFDSYKQQDVVIFEEFRSSLKIADMLNYLDGYPLELPARYANKVACYTKVYIITNIPLERQYKTVQDDAPETWAAFKRRIPNNNIVYFGDGKTEDEWIQEDLPFPIEA